MPRLAILTTDEIKAFDKPPRFTKVQREKYFHVNEKLSALLKTLRDPSYKLCVILQWGYFRVSGRFFLVKDFHLKEFGRLIKTQFILTYIDELPLRQHIEKQLNKVELSNKFAKAVFFEKNQEFTVATREEQELVANCKSLIQTWQHVNMRGEYDFTKAANSAIFDLNKILALKIEKAG